MQQSATMSLFEGFAESVRKYPQRDALVVDGETSSYARLAQEAASVSASIERAHTGRSALVGLLAHRSAVAYAGVLGILGAGKGYVPLNPKFPAARLARMLNLSGADVVVVGTEGLSSLKEMLPAITEPVTVIAPDVGSADELSRSFPQHRFLPPVGGSLNDAAPVAPDVTPDSVAYLLFTSGSTGEPKGVAVSHANVFAYVRTIADRYDVRETDRFSQHFDLTFDLSVHDMFVCWQRGACLCCVPDKALIAPAKFIRDYALTMWFSVPSAVGFMQRMGMLKPGAFPSLRCSLFCGEPLPAEFAAAWQQAAPDSIVENLYGPTEATIAITAYRWCPDESPGQCVSGIVPIGVAFDGQRTAVVDTDGHVVSIGTSGELMLGGSQVTGRYWNNPEKTAERFVSLPEVDDGTWYRTGDVVREGDDGCLYFLGRMDDQVKIRGYRVELQEIDHVVREAAGTQHAVAVAWPVRQGSADGVVAFICGSSARNEEDILSACRQTLPEYMVPRKIGFVEAFPLNANGKIDRKRLFQIAEEGGI